MEKRNIIVIGASAGGFDALKKLVDGLPEDMDASIFIVWHMAVDVKGILPQVLNKSNSLFAAHGEDREVVKPGRIYVAPPDHHMLIEKGMIRITRGPKENRFRPAIDPLFRSAAFEYGPRVIGIVLSGALDDGSAGLWTIKERGGLAIVQDPDDAEVSSMPSSAMRAVDVDYKVAMMDMPKLLVELSDEPVPRESEIDSNDDERTKLEIGIAMEDKSVDNNILEHSQLTPYTCPDCHGVLSSIREGKRVRFRCHTGHAFSADSLLMTISESIEESLWSAIRNIHESVFLLNQIGDHFAEANQPKVAAIYFRKAREAKMRAELVRQAVFSNEQLNPENISQQAEYTEPNP
jgi:two-component system chemotaxis response regulator CheB